MTARRLAQAAHKSPTLTRGDDRPETPCQRDLHMRLAIARGYGRRMTPTPFDRLIDVRGEDHPRSRHILEEARNEARSMCNQCPIKLACWDNNADEEWLQRLTATPNDTRPERGPGSLAECGTHSGWTRHRRNHETPCALCVEARRVYVRDYRARTSGSSNDAA